MCYSFYFSFLVSFKNGKQLLRERFYRSFIPLVYQSLVEKALLAIDFSRNGTNKNRKTKPIQMSDHWIITNNFNKAIERQACSSLISAWLLFESSVSYNFDRDTGEFDIVFLFCRAFTQHNFNELCCVNFSKEILSKFLPISSHPNLVTNRGVLCEFFQKKKKNEKKVHIWTWFVL